LEEAIEEAGDEGETALALLLARFLYWLIFSWKDVIMGERPLGDILPRSSADLDQARQDMFRRSPALVLGEGGVDVAPGMSREPGSLALGRSTTDLETSWG